MIVNELLEVLHAAGIAQTLDGESLVVKGDKGSLSPEIKSRLVEHKAELVAYLKSEANPCIHSFFEAAARSTPDAVAIVYGELSITYGVLNAQANRLAHHLIELGVCREDKIALSVERGVAMAVGLLAILKAGAAYVPLDPAYSSERLGLIVTDCAPRFVVCDAAGRVALGDAALAGRTVVDLEPVRDGHAETASWSAQPDHDPQVPGLTGTNLAYVIYTSGSTGVPKGVMVEHAQVVRLFVSKELEEFRL